MKITKKIKILNFIEVVLVCVLLALAIIPSRSCGMVPSSSAMDPANLGNAPTAYGPNDDPGPGPMAPDPELSQ